MTVSMFDNTPLSAPPRRVYVASSWRNPMQAGVVAALRSAGIDCYDFRHPAPGNEGFHWSEVGMASYNRETNGEVPVGEYLTGMEHPVAVRGFARDYDAMVQCDACVLVLPCGRSAHLELGWFTGRSKPTAVLLEGEVIPELMYGLVDYLAPTLFDLLGWLGVKD